MLNPINERIYNVTNCIKCRINVLRKHNPNSKMLPWLTRRLNRALKIDNAHTRLKELDRILRQKVDVPFDTEPKTWFTAKVIYKD